MAASNELAEKGYTSDRVEVRCDICGRKAVCRWERNMTPGIHYGRPRIEIPEDWKVVIDAGKEEQTLICERCHPYESSKWTLPLL